MEDFCFKNKLILPGYGGWPCVFFCTHGLQHYWNSWRQHRGRASVCLPRFSWSREGGGPLRPKEPRLQEIEFSLLAFSLQTGLHYASPGGGAKPIGGAPKPGELHHQGQRLWGMGRRLLGCSGEGLRAIGAPLANSAHCSCHPAIP